MAKPGIYDPWRSIPPPEPQRASRDNEPGSEGPGHAVMFRGKSYGITVRLNTRKPENPSADATDVLLDAVRELFSTSTVYAEQLKKYRITVNLKGAALEGVFGDQQSIPLGDGVAVYLSTKETASPALVMDVLARALRSFWGVAHVQAFLRRRGICPYAR